MEKMREDMADGQSIVFTRNIVVNEIFFGIRQTCAIVLLELMFVSFIIFLCVKQCQLVCTRDGL